MEKRTEGGVPDQSSGESLELGCAKLFSPTSNKARGRNKFVLLLSAVLLSGLKKLHWFHKARWWEQVKYDIWHVISALEPSDVCKVTSGMVSKTQARHVLRRAQPALYCSWRSVQESVWLSYRTSYGPFHQKSELKQPPKHCDRSISVRSVWWWKQTREPQARELRGEASSLVFKHGGICVDLDKKYIVISRWTLPLSY